MTIAAKLFLTCVVLFFVVTIAAFTEPKRRGYSGKVEVFLGFLVVCSVIGMPASFIAWIWGW